MSDTVCRTSFGMSTYVFVVISPATCTWPVMTNDSHATRPIGSSARTASSTVSEIWSAILSGWPSVTDSDVKRYSFSLSVMNCSFSTRSGDFDEIGDHELTVAQPDVVRVRERLDACDLLARLLAELAEVDEREVQDSRTQAT